MATNSSTKKAAKLAQQSGGGPALRFQGGTIFPLAVALTIVVGLALIIYGRATLPDADASPPTIDDHWHAAYGFNLCGEWYFLDGALEEVNAAGTGFANSTFARTGVHSHDDGAIHWHAYTSASVGSRAELGLFLDGYDVDIEDDKIVFPSETALEDPRTNALVTLEQEWEEGETTCDGEPGEVSVVAWDNYADTDGGTRYIANMESIPVDQDGMAFGIYFGPADGEREMPPWSDQLPALGAVDSQQVTPEDLQSTATTEPGSNTAPGEETDTSSPADNTDETTPTDAPGATTTTAASTTTDAADSDG